jgi:hypothetical protein
MSGASWYNAVVLLRLWLSICVLLGALGAGGWCFATYMALYKSAYAKTADEAAFDIRFALPRKASRDLYVINREWCTAEFSSSVYTEVTKDGNTTTYPPTLTRLAALNLLIATKDADVRYLVELNQVPAMASAALDRAHGEMAKVIGWATLIAGAWTVFVAFLYRWGVWIARGSTARHTQQAARASLPGSSGRF